MKLFGKGDLDGHRFHGNQYEVVPVEGKSGKIHYEQRVLEQELGPLEAGDVQTMPGNYASFSKEQQRRMDEVYNKAVREGKGFKVATTTTGRNRAGKKTSKTTYREVGAFGIPLKHARLMGLKGGECPENPHNLTPKEYSEQFMFEAMIGISHDTSHKIVDRASKKIIHTVDHTAQSVESAKWYAKALKEAKKIQKRHPNHTLQEVVGLISTASAKTGWDYSNPFVIDSRGPGNPRMPNIENADAMLSVFDRNPMVKVKRADLNKVLYIKHGRKRVRRSERPDLVANRTGSGLFTTKNTTGVGVLGVEKAMGKNAYVMMRLQDLPSSIAEGALCALIRKEKFTYEGYTGKITPPHSMRAQARAALNIMHTGDVDTNLNGPKVRSFYIAIMSGGKAPALVVDTHQSKGQTGLNTTSAAKVLLKTTVSQGSIKDENWTRNHLDGSGNVAGVYNVYPVFEDTAMAALKRYNESHQEDVRPELQTLQPEPFQAVYWIYARNTKELVRANEIGRAILKKQRRRVSKVEQGVDAESALDNTFYLNPYTLPEEGASEEEPMTALQIVAEILSQVDWTMRLFPGSDYQETLDAISLEVIEMEGYGQDDDPDDSISKGERAGHPFRGNQWEKGQNGGGSGLTGRVSDESSRAREVTDSVRARAASRRQRYLDRRPSQRPPSQVVRNPESSPRLSGHIVNGVLNSLLAQLNKEALRRINEGAVPLSNAVREFVSRANILTSSPSAKADFRGRLEKHLNQIASTPLGIAMAVSNTPDYVYDPQRNPRSDVTHFLMSNAPRSLHYEMERAKALQDTIDAIPLYDDDGAPPRTFEGSPDYQNPTSRFSAARPTNFGENIQYDENGYALNQPGPESYPTFDDLVGDTFAKGEGSNTLNTEPTPGEAASEYDDLDAESKRKVSQMYEFRNDGSPNLDWHSTVHSIRAGLGTNGQLHVGVSGSVIADEYRAADVFTGEPEVNVGDTIGTFSRYLYPETGEIEHGSFTMYIKKEGIGGQFYTQSILESKAAGYKTIQTYAVNDSTHNGVVVWPRFGFKFKSGPNGIASNSGVIFSHASDAWTVLDKLGREVPEEARSSTPYVHIQDLIDHPDYLDGVDAQAYYYLDLSTLPDDYRSKNRIRKVIDDLDAWWAEWWKNVDEWLEPMLDREASLSKGESAGHPFRGNQYVKVARTGRRTAGSATLDARNLGQALVRDSQVPETGMSIKIASGFRPRSGYMISIAGHEEQISEIGKLTPQMVQAYVARHKAELSKPNNYLGGYHSPSGIVYLDVSQRRTGLSDAIRMGVQGDQESIVQLVGKGADYVYLKGPSQTAKDKALVRRAMKGEVFSKSSGSGTRLFLDYEATPEEIVKEIKRLCIG